MRSSGRYAFPDLADIRWNSQSLVDSNSELVTATPEGVRNKHQEDQ